jgi:hypothetical protein
MHRTPDGVRAAEFAEALDRVALRRSQTCEHRPMPGVRIDGEFLCTLCWCWIRTVEDDDEVVDDD